MSKALATFATQPLIVAKVGLQSKPPPERNGKPFKTFNEVIAHIIEHEGVMRLFKGIGPQLLKGIMVQGLLMLSKERYVQLIFTRKWHDSNNLDLGLNFSSFSFSVISKTSELNIFPSWHWLQMPLHCYQNRQKDITKRSMLSKILTIRCKLV